MTTATNRIYGIKAFFNGRVAGDNHERSLFHGIEGGTADRVIPDLPTFLGAAGRDYGILMKPNLVSDPFGGVDEAGNVCETIRPVENQFNLMRTSDGAVISPHTVTRSYAPLTLLDIAAEIQPWCNDGWVTPDAIFEGGKVPGSMEMLCLRMDAAGQLPNGEQWTHYIVFRNPHGSGGKARGTIIGFRSHCANTFGSIARGIEFTVGHRMSATMTDDERQAAMQARVKKAKDAWETAKRHIADLGERINVWSGARMTGRQAEQLTDTLLGIANLDDAKTRTVNRREAILAAFNMPKFGTHGATLYDWINACTFVNSSPNAASVQKSTVSSVDRMIRNVDPNGTGYKFEAKAEGLAEAFLVPAERNRRGWQ
jgi:hypothetical protein